MPRQAELMVLKFDAETGSFTRKVGTMERNVDRLGGRLRNTLRQIDRSTAGLAGSLTRAFGPLAAGLSVTGLVQGFRQISQEMRALADRADVLGLTAEQLQELRFAAEQSGIPVQRLDIAWQRFTRRIAEARQGGGELQKVLAQYKIDLEDANGATRSAIDIFKDLADATTATGDAQEQLRISFKAFDSEGASLVNLLRRGAIGFETFQQQARELGIVLEEDLVQATRELDRRFERLTWNLSVRFKRVTLEAFDFLGVLSARAPAERLTELRTELEAVQRQFEELRDLRTLPGLQSLENSNRLQGLVQEELRLQRLIERQERLIEIENRARGSGGLPGGQPTDQILASQDAVNQAIRDQIGLQQTQLQQLEEAIRLAEMLPRARFIEQQRLEAQAQAIEQNNLATTKYLAKVEDAAGRLFDLQNAQKGITEETENAIIAAEDFKSVATGAFGSLITQGQQVESVLARITQQFASIAVNRLGGQAFDALLGGLGFAAAKGGVALGGFKAFANGSPRVTRPTLGLVGEGAHNEAIVPLPDGRSIPVIMRGGGGGVTFAPTVNVSVTAGPEQSPQGIGEAVGREVTRSLRGLVREELQSQLRPGAQLNRGLTV